MPFRAFVSSTFKDLEHHRARVVADLRKAGVTVEAMEDWTASASEPKQFSRDRLEGCDFCVLLVGLRRGYVPPGESRSITQMEYNEAVRREMDILVYLVREDAAWPRSFDELDKDTELRPWREHLMEHYGVEFFDNDPASLDVKAAVARWIGERGAQARRANEVDSGASSPRVPSASSPPAPSPEAAPSPPEPVPSSPEAAPSPPEPAADGPSPQVGTEDAVVAESTGFLRGLTAERAWTIVFAVGFSLVVLMVVTNVGYRAFTADRHLKSPQQLTLTEYLEDPAHPRSGPLFFLSATPSAEVVLTDLKVAHVDEDSALLEDPAGADVLVAGDGMDALGLSVGGNVSLQVGQLERTPLGWVPAIPDLDAITWERFDRDEVDAIEQWKIVADGATVAARYVEFDERSFSSVVPEADRTLTLVEASALQDLPQLLGEWSTNRETVAIRGAELAGQGWRGREKPYFIVQAGADEWVAVIYEPQLFSEWHWAMDRLQGEQVVARGVPRPSDDADFNAIAATRPERLVMILDGYAISSPDGETVIHLATR